MGGDAPWGPPAPWPSERQRRVSLSPRRGCALVLARPPAQVQGLEVGVAGSAHLQASSAGWLEGPWPLCHLKEPPAQGPAWSTRVGLKSSVLFSRKLDGLARAFVFFSRPKDSSRRSHSVSQQACTMHRLYIKQCAGSGRCCGGQDK